MVFASVTLKKHGLRTMCKCNLIYKKIVVGFVKLGAALLLILSVCLLAELAEITNPDVYDIMTMIGAWVIFWVCATGWREASNWFTRV